MRVSLVRAQDGEPITVLTEVRQLNEEHDPYSQPHNAQVVKLEITRVYETRDEGSSPSLSASLCVRPDKVSMESVKLLLKSVLGSIPRWRTRNTRAWRSRKSRETCASGQIR